MMDLTEDEKQLVLLALGGLFQSGSLQGPLDKIETVLVLVRSIQSKLEIKKPPEGD